MQSDEQVSAMNRPAMNCPIVVTTPCVQNQLYKNGFLTHAHLFTTLLQPCFVVATCFCHTYFFMRSLLDILICIYFLCRWITINRIHVFMSILSDIVLTPGKSQGFHRSQEQLSFDFVLVKERRNVASLDRHATQILSKNESHFNWTCWEKMFRELRNKETRSCFVAGFMLAGIT